MASVPTVEALKRLKVVELKEKLSQVGLSTSGLKADLIQRYHNHLVQESLEQEEKDEGDQEEMEDVDERMFPVDVDERVFPQAQQPPPQQQAMHPPPPQHQPPPQQHQPPPQQQPPQENKPDKGLDEDLQIKVAIQQQLLEQQKEALARQQQQMIQQQQGPGPGGPPGQIIRPQPPPGPPGPPGAPMVQPPPQQAPRPPPLMAQPIQAPPGVRMQPPPPQQQQEDLMEKVRQQQMMLEVEKQNQMFEQQNKLIQQQEAERRMKEAELIRQQQIALMEAKREREEEQRKQQQSGPPMQMGGPPPPPVQGPMQQSGPQPGQMPPQMHPQQQGPPMHPQQMQPPGQQGMGPPPSSQGMMVQPQPQGIPPPQQQVGPGGNPNMPPQGMPHGMQGPPQMPQKGGPQMVPPVSTQQGPQPLMAQPIRPPQMQMQQGPPSGDGPRGPMSMTSQPPGPQMIPPDRMRMSGPPMSRPQPEKLPPPQLEDNEESREIKLPQALEKILAFKDMRAQEVGVSQEELDEMHHPTKELIEEEDNEEDVGYETFEMEEDAEKVEQQPAKESKNKKRKKKKKKAKKNRLMQQEEKVPEKGGKDEDKVTVEYIQEQLELDPIDPHYHTFAKIFEAFKIADVEKPKEDKKETKNESKKQEVPIKAKGIMGMGMEDDDDDDDMEQEAPKDDDDTPKLSKKKLKKLTRLSVAQLKQLVSRPDVVEMHDVTAQDPRLLVHLKATRNTVPVPRHWCFKRKYLQGKRGIEKPPFELPEYIKATGIMEMREALAEKEDQKNLKAKMREKIRPKMGKIDIDYQKLHDAFFRWQVKPKMTIHGDLYYEGKEFETRLKEKKPGNLSDELRTALGMPLGPNAEKFPPPWLIAMQRYGPPPSYPNLKIPGLNAPIPETCSFGYHAGGWGKPPVDENGKPLYGDVFGTQSTDFQVPVQEEDLDKSHWGELEEESSEEEESEEESEGEEDDTGLITPGPEGLVTPSGITSVPMGVETPDMIELRKKRIEDAMDQGGETPALYTILPEKKSAVGGAMMGSAHIYDMTGVAAGKKVEGKVPTEGIEVALNPEELDLDTAAMQAKYDQTMREQQSQLEKEDLSDMVAEHAAKQKKRKKQQQDSGKAAKKYKEFKF